MLPHWFVCIINVYEFFFLIWARPWDCLIRSAKKRMFISNSERGTEPHARVASTGVAPILYHQSLHELYTPYLSTHVVTFTVLASRQPPFHFCCYQYTPTLSQKPTGQQYCGWHYDARAPVRCTARSTTVFNNHTPCSDALAGNKRDTVHFIPSSAC